MLPCWDVACSSLIGPHQRTNPFEAQVTFQPSEFTQNRAYAASLQGLQIRGQQYHARVGLYHVYPCKSKQLVGTLFLPCIMPVKGQSSKTGIRWCESQHRHRSVNVLLLRFSDTQSESYAELPASREISLGDPWLLTSTIRAYTQTSLSSCLRLVDPVDPPPNYRGDSLGSHGVDVVEGGGSCGEAVDGSRSVVETWRGCACIHQPELPFPNNKQHVLDPIMDLRGGSDS